MKELTKEIVMKLLGSEYGEWIEEEDYWTGSSIAYKDLPYGYDVNIFTDVFNEIIFARFINNIGCFNK